MIADGVALPALSRAGRWKDADGVQGYTDIGAPWFALADSCQKKYANQAVPEAPPLPGPPVLLALNTVIELQNRR